MTNEASNCFLLMSEEGLWSAVLCVVSVDVCLLSNADCRLSGVAVGGSCWFVVVACWLLIVCIDCRSFFPTKLYSIIMANVLVLLY